MWGLGGSGEGLGFRQAGLGFMRASAISKSGGVLLERSGRKFESKGIGRKIEKSWHSWESMICFANVGSKGRYLQT